MRKLAWFAVFFAAAALFILWVPVEAQKLLLIVPAVFLAGMCPTLARRWRHKKPAQLLRTALLGFAVGCLYVLLWQTVMQRDAEALLAREQTVEATVLEDSAEASFGLRTEVRIGRLRCCLFTNGKERLEAGQRIRVHASFASTAEKTGSDYYLTQGVPVFGYAREDPVVLGYAEAYWRFLPAKLGRILRERIRILYDRNSASFLLAVLTGERRELREDIWFYSMLRTSGVSHTVAVSGMHLSFLVMFLYTLLGRGKLSAAVCIPVTLAFMAMTGFTASVVRAGVMQLAVCGAKLLRREYDSLSALGLALLLLLLINPYSVRNMGLILSFASTLGILLFYGEIRTVLPAPPKKWGKHSLPARLWHGIRASLAVTLSASVFTVPLNALFFRQISLLAPLTNLLVLPAVSLCFSLGLIGVLVSFVYLPAGMVFRMPLSWLVAYIRLVTGWIGGFPLSALYIRSLYLPCWIGLTWFCMALYRLLPGLEHRFRSFLITAAVGLVVFLGLSYGEPALEDMRFGALDVGQGQCLVLSAPSGVTVIDCGGSLVTNAGDLAAEYLLSMGRFRVETLVLTHFHEDHVNGVEELLRRMKVERLYCPRPAEDDWAALSLLDFARERGAGISYVEDDILWLGEQDLTLALVPPLNQEKENESGLCIAALGDGFSFLCTGDAGRGTEKRLLERLRLEHVGLLVAGHHGSAGSVSQELLEALQPKAVVVSVGRNSYGLPAENTLQRIRDCGAAVYRTDEYGDLILRVRQGEAQWAK